MRRTPGLRLCGPWAACLLFAANVSAAAEDVGRFASLQSLSDSPWQVVRLDEDVPPTRFRLTAFEGVAAVEATAEASMALLARPVNVDLRETPVLCWRWWIDSPLDGADLNTKAGDDYAARVYVSFDLPAESLSFGTRAKLALARRLFGQQVPDAAISYVWDNRHAVGTQGPNAYTERAWMIVQRSGDDLAQQWVEERRDVLADLTSAFDTVGELQLVAITSDTDNTGEQARALFADLHFVSADEACRFDEAAD